MKSDSIKEPKGVDAQMPDGQIAAPPASSSDTLDEPIIDTLVWLVLFL
jgi:hypothetical protein